MKTIITEINEFFMLSGLITEQATALKKLFSQIDFNDIKNIIKTGVDDVEVNKIRNSFDDIANIGADELLLIIKKLEPNRVAKLLLDKELIFTKNSLNISYENLISKIKSGEYTFDKILDTWRKSGRENFFGKISGDIDDELIEISDAYVDELSSDFIKIIKKTDEELYNEIMSFGASIGAKGLSKFNSLFDNFLTQNFKVIKDAYLRLFKSFDSINKEIDTVFKEIAEKRSKDPSANIDTEIKKIESLISSAVGKDKRLYDDIMNAVYERNRKYMDVTPFTRRHITNKIDNLKVILKNEKTREWGSMDAFKMYMNAWGRLLNIKNIKSLEWWERFFNFIIQASPYTTEEIAKRIRTTGVGKVVAQRLVGTAFTAYVVMPAIFGTLKAFFATLEYLKDEGLYNDLGLSGEFTTEGPLKNRIIEAYKSSMPDSLLDVPLFTTYIDDVIINAIKLGNLDPKATYTSGELEKIEKGWKILNGEEVEDAESQDIRLSIEDKYPDIPDVFLNTRVHEKDGKAFYYEYEGERFTKQYPIMAKGDKIYVVNTDLNKAIEINKLY